MTRPGIRVEHLRGSAAAFHAREVPRSPDPIIWSFEVTSPALVLGSTQSLDLVDLEAARGAGVEVVRRRSGGGAVWLAPDEVTWIDVVLPASHPLWDADVSGSALWLGGGLADVLDPGGADAVVVHTGSVRRSRWSDLVCFAGLAPGEVTVGGAKVVGISQRRTREAARFQCAVLHRWDPAPMLELLRLDEDERRTAATAVATAARGIEPSSASTLVDAIVRALTPRG